MFENTSSILECLAADKNSNASYPIIAEYCTDLAIDAESSLLTSENLQSGVKLSFPAFSFVSNADTLDQFVVNATRMPPPAICDPN